MAVIPQSALTSIVDAVRKGRCIPFLGAGVSATARGKPGLPLGGSLAKLMVEKMTKDGNNGAMRNPGNLPEVATHYEHYYKRYGLFNFMKDQLPHQTLAPLPAHESLAKLPFRIIITTNYDTLMERALDGVKSWRRVIQPRTGFRGSSVPASLYAELFSPGANVIVYKSHGCFSEDPNDNLVVTDDDYLELLATMRSDEESPPKAIAGPFAVSTLLFLGFGLEDVDFKMLYKAIEKFPANMRPPAYAIQLTSSAFAKQYWSRKGIEIYDCDLSDFLQELVQTYGP